MNVYIGRSEHFKKRHHKNFHSGSSVDVFSTSAKTTKRRPLDATLPSGKEQLGWILHSVTFSVFFSFFFGKISMQYKLLYMRGGKKTFIQLNMKNIEIHEN